MTATPKPLVLIILDGFGHSESPDYNAIYAAKKPVWDRLLATQPHGLISGSGMDVGLPDGQMGNSEVGHMNLGAGRVVYQDFTRVTKAIRDGEFFENPVIAGAVDKAVAADKAVHILGLLSPGGVHSHEDHLVAMAQMAARRGAGKIYLHAFLDGRDTPPKSAQPSLERLDATFAGLGKGRIASIIGRYFAMDRDNRWDRVQAAYELIVDGKAEFTADSSVAALEAAYARGESDEFVKATAVEHGKTQLRIAETEKYAHVTFFFSGGREEPYEGEERILIPSPKVATYDLQPEMSAPEVTDRIVEAIEQQRYDVIVVNYANGDMVGHTGVFEAAVKAVECLDTCMGRIVEALDKVGGEALITADHGNVEQMEDESTGQAHTAHTCEPVPFVYVGKRKLSIREGGVLADVAPTMLTLMGLEQPAEMTGRSIVTLG